MENSVLSKATELDTVLFTLSMLWSLLVYPSFAFSLKPNDSCNELYSLFFLYFHCQVKSYIESKYLAWYHSSRKLKTGSGTNTYKLLCKWTCAMRKLMSFPSDRNKAHLVYFFGFQRKRVMAKTFSRKWIFGENSERQLMVHNFKARWIHTYVEQRRNNQLVSVDWAKKIISY